MLFLSTAPVSSRRRYRLRAIGIGASQRRRSTASKPFSNNPHIVPHTGSSNTFPIVRKFLTDATGGRTRAQSATTRPPFRPRDPVQPSSSDASTAADQTDPRHFGQPRGWSLSAWLSGKRKTKIAREDRRQTEQCWNQLRSEHRTPVDRNTRSQAAVHSDLFPPF